MKNLKIVSMLLAALFTTAVHAENECSTVISLSKLKKQTVEDKNSIETASSSFCDEYRKASQAGSVMSVSASYKLLSASFSKSNVSAEEIASKFCKTDNSYNKRDDAYRQYIETLAPDAFTAYEACLTMQNNSLNMRVSAFTPRTFQMIIEYTQKDENAKAIVAFSSSPGVSCKWDSDGSSKSRTFSAAGADTLNCTRANPKAAEFVTVIKTSGVGSTMSVPWIAMDDSGYALDAFGTLQNRVTDLESQLANTRKLADDLTISTNKTKLDLTSVDGKFARITPLVQCSGDGFFPRPAAPACPAGYKESNQFTHSAPGGAHGYGGNCKVCIGLTN